MVSRYTISFECCDFVVAIVALYSVHIWNCRALIILSVFVLLLLFSFILYFFELKSQATSRALKNLVAPPEWYTLMQLTCKISCKLMWMHAVKRGCSSNLTFVHSVSLIFNRKLRKKLSKKIASLFLSLSVCLSVFLSVSLSSLLFLLFYPS